MAQRNELPWCDDTYAAEDIWKERCFLSDTALFHDKPIWTLDNLLTFQQLMVFNQDFRCDNFWEKLRKQSQNANPNVIQLAAELMWFIYLITDSMTPNAKKLITPEEKTGSIDGLTSLSVFSPESRKQFLSDRILRGVANPKRYCIPNKFTFLVYLVIIMIH